MLLLKHADGKIVVQRDSAASRPFIIGSGPECNARLLGNKIAGKQCALRYVQGSWTVHNLGERHCVHLVLGLGSYVKKPYFEIPRDESVFTVGASKLLIRNVWEDVDDPAGDEEVTKAQVPVSSLPLLAPSGPSAIVAAQAGSAPLLGPTTAGVVVPGMMKATATGVSSTEKPRQQVLKIDIKAGNDKGKRYKVRLNTRGVVTLGRERDCRVLFRQDLSVSRHHAQIMRDPGTDQFLYVHLPSSKGRSMYAIGAGIHKGAGTLLQHGDVLKMGDHVLVAVVAPNRGQAEVLSATMTIPAYGRGHGGRRRNARSGGSPDKRREGGGNGFLSDESSSEGEEERQGKDGGRGGGVVEARTPAGNDDEEVAKSAPPGTLELPPLLGPDAK